MYQSRWPELGWIQLAGYSLVRAHVSTLFTIVAFFAPVIKNTTAIHGGFNLIYGHLLIILISIIYPLNLFVEINLLSKFQMHILTY